jgi:hypothetical protein
MRLGRMLSSAALAAHDAGCSSASLNSSSSARCRVHVRIGLVGDPRDEEDSERHPPGVRPLRPEKVADLCPDPDEAVASSPAASRIGASDARPRVSAHRPMRVFGCARRRCRASQPMHARETGRHREQGQFDVESHGRLPPVSLAWSCCSVNAVVLCRCACRFVSSCFGHCPTAYTVASRAAPFFVEGLFDAGYAGHGSEGFSQHARAAGKTRMARRAQRCSSRAPRLSAGPDRPIRAARRAPRARPPRARR